MIPFGEFAPDVADLNTQVASVATNVLPGVNSYLPFKSLESVSNALDNACVGAVTMKDNDGNNFIYAGDKTKLYNISGVTVADYSKVGDYTDNAEKWAFTKWDAKVIGSKFGDTPQIMTLGGTTFADLTGSPPQGKTMAVIRDFVVFGNTWDSTDGNVTNRVRWSGFNDETEWTAGTNQSGSQDIQGSGGAVQKVIGGEYGIIFLEKSIHRMTYVGTPVVFQFDEVEPNIGTPAPGSVIQHGSNIYYLAQDGFYVMRSGTTSEPIGVNRIDGFFWGDVDESNITLMSGSVDPENGVVIWSYPSTGTTVDKLIIYNYKINKWSTSDQTTQVLLQGATSAQTLEGLDTFGNMDTLTSSLDSAVWKGGTFQLSAFTSDNELGFFSGDTLSGIMETGELSTEGRITSIKRIRSIIDGSSSIVVSTRNNLSDTPVAGNSFSMDSTQKAEVRTRARYNRIKLTTSGDFTHAQGVEPESTLRGNR